MPESYSKARDAPMFDPKAKLTLRWLVKQARNGASFEPKKIKNFDAVVIFLQNKSGEFTFEQVNYTTCCR
jgi:hypothetical protein